MSARADQLAAALGEARGPGRKAFRRAGRILGDRALRVVGQETLRLLAAGGLTTLDGTRPRTPGGVFLRLVREAATDAERRRIFGPGAGPVTVYQTTEAFRARVRMSITRGTETEVPA